MMRKLSIALVLLSVAFTASAREKTLDQLKDEAAKAHSGHQAVLYAKIAQALVDVADQQFTNSRSADAHRTIQDVLENASRAHDVALQSHKKLKEVEIRLRETQRHLHNVRRTLALADRPAVEAVENKLEGFRQDLLNTMFAPRKEKK